MSRTDKEAKTIQGNVGTSSDRKTRTGRHVDIRDGWQVGRSKIRARWMKRNKKNRGSRERERRGGMAGRAAKSRSSRNYFLRSFDNRGTAGIIRICARVHIVSPSLSFSLPLYLFPKLYSKPAYSTRLTETRRSDSNPEVRELIVMGWPLCTGVREQFASNRSCYLWKWPNQLRAHRHFTVIN